MTVVKRCSVLLFSLSLVLGQGSLLLVGGGGEDYNDWSDLPYAWFVEQADSGIVINIDVSSTASWYPSYFQSFGADPASQSLQIITRAMADDPTTADLLRTASGIFIEGGDQWDYVETWAGTLAEQAIIDVLNAGGVIGGTSAGLAVLGQVDFSAEYGSIIAPEALDNPCRLDMALSEALLPLLPDVITDSHFHSRGRLGRLIPMLARWEHESDTWLTGIGIADNTAACVDAQGVMTVYGEGSVSVLYAQPGITHNVDCSDTQPLELTSLGMDQLIHGSVYNLNSKTLLDGGGTLLPVTPNTAPVTYQSLSLDGSSDITAEQGAYQVNNLSGNLAAWRGNLSLNAVTGNLPGTVIMPRIWHEYDEYENRLVGVLWAMGQHPGLTGILIDSDVTATVNDVGILSSNGQVWVLDGSQLTHAGFPEHNTCYGGFLGMRIHIITEDTSYDLQNQAPVSIKNDSSLLPDEFLLTAWPNPFNPETSIQYAIPDPSHVNLSITDITGRTVVKLEDAHRSAGTHSRVWDGLATNGKEVESGIYFCVLRTSDELESIKLVLMK